MGLNEPIKSFLLGCGLWLIEEACTNKSFSHPMILFGPQESSVVKRLAQYAICIPSYQTWVSPSTIVTASFIIIQISIFLLPLEFNQSSNVTFPKKNFEFLSQ